MCSAAFKGNGADSRRIVKIYCSRVSSDIAHEFAYIISRTTVYGAGELSLSYSLGGELSAKFAIEPYVAINELQTPTAEKTRFEPRKGKSYNLYTISVLWCTCDKMVPKFLKKKITDVKYVFIEATAPQWEELKF